MACCTRFVFRCFKCLERAADRITGAAGPFFVAAAYLLISTGTFAFCTSTRADNTFIDLLIVLYISRSNRSYLIIQNNHHPNMYLIRHKYVRELLLGLHRVSRIR